MSTLAENFLRRLHEDHFIHHVEGTDQVFTSEDTDIPNTDGQPLQLQPLDERMHQRLEKVMDLVLFRYGSTGCRHVIQRAVELARVVPFYPVRSVHTYAPLRQFEEGCMFVDCWLVDEECSLGEVAAMLFSESELKRPLVFEGTGARQLGEDDLVKDHPVVAFKFRGGDDQNN